MEKEAINLFLYWIEERWSIYLKKEAKGLPPPWTDDGILATYKFTTPFRELDRVSREWARLVPWTPQNKRDFIFRTCLFRSFNWPETYEALDERGFIRNWTTKQRSIRSFLHERQRNKIKNFTGAYIIPQVGSTQPKIDVICDQITDFHNRRGELRSLMRKYKSLETTSKYLQQVRGVGGFIAYEIVCDFKESPLLSGAVDKMTWANPGPGAKRGIHRLITGREAKKPNGLKIDYVQYMRDLLRIARRHLAKSVPRSRVDMRCIEHSLCEYDKYCRAHFGEGAPKAMYKGAQ